MLKFKKSRSPFRSYSAIFIDALLLALLNGMLWVVLIVTFGPSVVVTGCMLRLDTCVGSVFVVLGTGFVGESDCTGTAAELAKNCFKKVWFCRNISFRLEWICELLSNRIILSIKNFFEYKSIPSSLSCFDSSADFSVFEFSAHWMRISELLWGYLYIFQCGVACMLNLISNATYDIVHIICCIWYAFVTLSYQSTENYTICFDIQSVHMVFRPIISCPGK